MDSNRILIFLGHMIGQLDCKMIHGNGHSAYMITYILEGHTDEAVPTSTPTYEEENYIKSGGA